MMMTLLQQGMGTEKSLRISLLRFSNSAPSNSFIEHILEVGRGRDYGNRGSAAIFKVPV